MTVTFTIDGEPMGKQRPKFARQGNYTRTYTSDKTVNYETLVKLAYQSQCEDTYFDDKPIAVEIFANFSIPKSTSNKKRLQMLRSEIFPTKKPDADNICKIILDPLNKIAFNDDSQVVDINVHKRYAEYPYVEVIIRDMV